MRSPKYIFILHVFCRLLDRLKMWKAPKGEPITEEEEVQMIINNYFLNPNILKMLKRYRGVVMLNEYENLVEKLDNFQVRDDDFWLVGFPKTGTLFV